MIDLYSATKMYYEELLRDYYLIKRHFRLSQHDQTMTPVPDFADYSRDLKIKMSLPRLDSGTQNKFDPIIICIMTFLSQPVEKSR